MPMFVPAVEASAVPMQQFQAPESKNYAADSAAQAGNILMKQGEFITKVVENYKNDVATAKVKDADNAMSSAFSEILLHPETGFMGKMGKNAVDAQKDTVKAVDDYVAQVSSNMVDPVEQAMFKKAANTRVAAMKQQILGHTLQQAKTWRVQSSGDRMMSAGQEMIASADPSSEAYQKALETFKNESAEKSSLLGLDPASAKIHLQSELTKVHAESVQQLISRNAPITARSYLEDAIKNGEVMPGAVNEIKKHIDTSVDQYLGKNTGDAVFDQRMEEIGGDINKAIPESEMLSDINSSKELSDHAKEIASAKVIGNINRLKAQRSQDAQESSNQLHKIMNHDGSMSEYSQALGYISSLTNVDETTKGNLKEHAMRFYGIREKQSEARSDARIQKHLDSIVRAKDEIDNYTNNKYGKLSFQDAIIKFAPTLGSQAENVARVIEKMNTKMENPKLGYADFNRKLSVMAANKEFQKQLGFDPTSKDADVIQAKNILLEATLDNMAAFGAKGKQISLDQALSMALKEETVKSKIMGFIPSTKKYKAYMIQTLPESEQRQIVENNLRMAVKPVTPGNIEKGLQELRKKRSSNNITDNEE